jgi:dTDP-4-amino-4,6-dideoxygalactose transaminase
MKKLILNTIKDLCSNFLYYDRKEDEELSIEDLNNAVKSGVITVDEMVDEFRKNLEATYGKTKIVIPNVPPEDICYDK